MESRWRRNGGSVKFTCSTKDIASAVGAASKVVNAHTTVPILSNVLLTADDGSIRVRATDLELTLEQSFPAEIAESGAVTVPARLFGGYLGNLPAGLARAHRLAVPGLGQSRALELRFSRASGRRVPAAADRAKRAVVRDPGAKRFREGVAATIFAASNEEARGAVLMGTLLELDGDKITLVATDGYRLATLDVDARARDRGTAKYIVPSRALERGGPQSRRRRDGRGDRARRASEPAAVHRRHDLDRRAAGRRAVPELLAGDPGEVRPLASSSTRKG